MKKEPTLQFNKTTGYYEGMLLIQVDSELFRRFLLNAVEEDQAADLTDPETWIAAIAKIGRIVDWIGRPHVTLTPIISPALPSIQAEVQQSESTQKPKTKAELLEERLREKARQVAPYKWDDLCLTPIGDHSLPQSVRDDIGRLRYDERQVLKRLRKEWEAGRFSLNPVVAQEQTEYEQQEKSHLTQKIHTMATATNGSRLR